jgi:hypothetical protein
VLDLIASGSTTVVSTASHLVPTALGAIAVRRDGLAWRSVAHAWALWVGAQALALAFTPPALNVNVVWTAYGVLDEYLPGIWAERAFHVVSALPCLVIAAWVLRWRSASPRLQARIQPR